MAWTSYEALRVQEIEAKLSELSTALNALSTKRQLNALLAILQAQIKDLEERVGQVEQLS